MVVAQVDGGHPLVDDELPEVPPGGRPGARQCQAVRQLLGHPWRRRKGANNLNSIDWKMHFRKRLFDAISNSGPRFRVGTLPWWTRLFLG